YLMLLMIKIVIDSLSGEKRAERIAKSSLDTGENFQHTKTTNRQVIRAIATLLCEDDVAIADVVGGIENHLGHCLESLLGNHLTSQWVHDRSVETTSDND